MAKDKKKNKGLFVDMTDVETRVLVPEDQYRLKVDNITAEESSEGNSYLKWTFTISGDEKKVKGQKLYYNTSLLPQALWNLGNLLRTLGVEVPQGKMKLELEEYIGLECMGTVEHEKYEGKTQARLTDFSPLTDEEEEDEDKEEDDKDEEADDEDEDDSDEAEEESDDEDDEEEDEDEESEAVSADEVKAMKLDDLQALVKKHELKIKKASNKPKKFRAQVLEALEEAGLLGD